MSMCALKYYTMKKSDRVYFTANILAATDRLELVSPVKHWL